MNGFQKRNCTGASPGLREACGFTLIELILALGVTSLMGVTLVGLTVAVQTSWTISQTYQNVSLQGRGALERIRWMINQAGTYSLNGGSVQLGLKVIPRTVDGVTLPDVLVVWSGGRSGGIQEKKQPATSLPRVNELVIFTPDPNIPSRFVEIQLSANTSTIHFGDAGFETTVKNLILNSAASDRLTLFDTLRTCRVVTGGTLIGNARFELTQQPSDEKVTTTTVGSDQWYALAWCQGMVSSRGGTRQATVRIELQLETVPGTVYTGSGSPTAIPVPGCASVRYAYRA